MLLYPSGLKGEQHLTLEYSKYLIHLEICTQYTLRGKKHLKILALPPPVEYGRRLRHESSSTASPSNLQPPPADSGRPLQVEPPPIAFISNFQPPSADSVRKLQPESPPTASGSNLQPPSGNFGRHLQPKHLKPDPTPTAFSSSCLQSTPSTCLSQSPSSASQVKSPTAPATSTRLHHFLSQLQI